MTFANVNGQSITLTEWHYLNTLTAGRRTTGAVAAEHEPDGRTPFGRWRSLRVLLSLRERGLTRYDLEGIVLHWSLTKEAAVALGVNR